MSPLNMIKLISPVIALVVFSPSVSADLVQLQNGTATYSQQAWGGGPYHPSQAIDGIFSGPSDQVSNGWTVASFDSFGGATSETAVWEAVSNLGPSVLTFNMYFLDPNPGHLLGRFRFSVTADDRSTYADGLGVGGDVAANWTVLTNPIVQGPSGMTFTYLSDNSILVGGAIPGTAIYEVTYNANVSGITGIRLEALEHPSLPGGSGPGFFERSGNFVLTELQLNVSPIPEPETYAMLLAGLGLLGFHARRRKLRT